MSIDEDSFGTERPSRVPKTEGERAHELMGVGYGDSGCPDRPGTDDEHVDLRAGRSRAPSPSLAPSGSCSADASCTTGWPSSRW